MGLYVANNVELYIANNVKLTLDILNILYAAFLAIFVTCTKTDRFSKYRLIKKDHKNILK